MNKIFISLALLSGSLALAQINFKGCTALFEDQAFVLNQTGVDAQNKKIYITTPVTGDQPCGGLGTCEFKIQWNNAQTRWEFLADTGNGDFVAPYVIYYNATGNNAATNPPSNIVGAWVENTAVTEGACGGNLTAANSTMTGDVHTTLLATTLVNNKKIQVFPNPVVDFINFSGVTDGKTLDIYNSAGQLVRTLNFAGRTDVRGLPSGVYIVKITSSNSVKEFKFIKQ